MKGVLLDDKTVTRDIYLLVLVKMWTVAADRLLAWRDGRVQTIYGGTTEIMKEIVGKSLGLGSR